MVIPYEHRLRDVT